MIKYNCEKTIIKRFWKKQADTIEEKQNICYSKYVDLLYIISFFISLIFIFK